MLGYAHRDHLVMNACDNEGECGARECCSGGKDDTMRIPFLRCPILSSERKPLLVYSCNRALPDGTKSYKSQDSASLP